MKRGKNKLRGKAPSVKLVAAVGLIIVALDQAAYQVALVWFDSDPKVALWELLWTLFLVTAVCSGYIYLRRRKGLVPPVLQVAAAKETSMPLSREAIEQNEKLSLAGVLAAGIAHEIRNPLTSLRGFIQLLQHKQPFYTKIMLEEIDRINSIVSELLILAKPKVASYESKQLHLLIEDTLMLLKAQALLYNIEMTAAYHPDALQGKVLCDENRIKQVFINLVKNAMEAMLDGKGAVHIQLSQEDQWLLVSVTDEGGGIPRELIDSIGKPFITTKENGTGLGLMVCNQIITEHNGTIQFESGRKGTRIEVRLPQHC